jgi:two-component system OmpR family sensor kinase
VKGTLAQRISLLTIAVSVITGVVAGVLSVGLTRTVSESSARRELRQLADATVSTVNNRPDSTAARLRARSTLGALNIQLALLDQSGSVTAGQKLARDALTAAQRARLVGVGSLSLRATVDGRAVFVEARVTSVGGVVLVQRRSDALAAADDAIRRVILALVIGVLVAVILGALVAYRIARPLRRTAQAAHALADGRRDVRVNLDGPAEVAEVGAAVNSLAAALSASEVRQRDFLMSVSHDLRTPLTAISGFAESLADNVVPPEQAAHVGAVMLGEAQRLNRMVADLLDLARLDAQDFRVDPIPIDLVALVRDAALVWARRCAQEGVRFELQAPDHPLVVTTDAVRIRQVLDGLLENALRVTPAGAPMMLAVAGAPSRESTDPTPPERSDPRAGVVLEVRDGGPGLTDADLPVAFEQSVLYERYRGVRKVGTGLGLAIVDRLVRRLGGTVAAGHAVEGGARFTVWLPI